MILGYILIGIIAGCVGAGTALGLGASVWSVLGIYTLSGCAGTIAMPVGRGIARLLKGRDALPGPEALTAAAPQAPTTAPTRNDVFTVMAVDDDPFILDLVTTIGASAGSFDIVTVSSGAEALALLADDTRTFDYLLCDISMPQMSGIELCHAVRKMDRYRDVPLVMLTARRDMEHMAAAFRAGATDYATKPFDIEALRLRFQAALSDFEAQGAQTAPAAGVTPAQAGTDTATLSAYLTLLSAPDAAATQVLAVRIDRLETLRARHAPDRLAAMLDRIAATVAGSLGEGQTVMAHTVDGDLVVAISATGTLDATRLERQITADLQAWDLAATRHDPTWSGVSVGPPVPLQGTRSRRAALAIGRAVGHAADLSLSRDSKALADLRQASGN